MATIPYLRVKIKTLAAEAAIIRHEERKFLPRWRSYEDPTYFRLRDHRIQQVRHESRCALLAYAFLRDKPYAAMEQKCWEAPDVARVTRLINRFGQTNNITVESVKEWMAGEAAMQEQAA